MSFMKGLKAIQVRPNPKEPEHISEAINNNITARRDAILEYLKDHGETSTEALATALKVNPRTCWDDLKAMKALGLVIARTAYNPNLIRYYRAINLENKDAS